jgi:hypothetical protein
MGMTASAESAMILPHLYPYEKAAYIYNICSSKNAVIFSSNLGKKCCSTAENIPKLYTQP